MARSIWNRVLGAFIVAALIGLIVATAAYAESPWWHLSSTSRPTYIRPGHAETEVQKLSVRATEGTYQLERSGLLGEDLGRTRFAVGEEPEQLQLGLEELYGMGNVVVTGGPGPNSYNPYEDYEIRFVGELADRPMLFPKVPEEHLNLPFPGEEEGHRVSVGLIANGRPDAQMLVTAVNLGDATANPSIQPIVLKDMLPPGLHAVAIEAYANEHVVEQLAWPLECSLQSVSCVFTGKNNGGATAIPPYEQIQMRILVDAEPGLKSGEVNAATVSGGGAHEVKATQSLVVSDSAASFGVNTYEMRPEEEGGGVDTHAGSHPFQFTTTLDLNETLENRAVEPADGSYVLAGKSVEMAKDLHFNLPVGLVGNPTQIPRCSLTQFLSNHCPLQAALGVARVVAAVPAIESGYVIPFIQPLYNIEPSVGEPARFGFLVNGEFPVLLDTAVRTGSDYGVTVNVPNITQTAEFLDSEVTFWGVPGDERHNRSRGEGCMQATLGEALGGKPQDLCPFEEQHPPPFLQLPTSCTGPLVTTMDGDSWQEPSNVLAPVSNTAPMPALDGCNRLQFNPSIEVTPDSQAGSTPTGLSVRVKVPQDVSLNPNGLSEADVKNTTVALPAGVAINPSGGDGLEGCSEEEIGLKNAQVPSCPNASKVGLVTVKTPLLPNPLEGSAYLADQNANPFGSLVALYVFVEDPISGTRVKVAGEVTVNPVTGQLVSTFKDTPQLPFETFELHFFGGDRAPLASPARCGAYTTTAAIEPWTESGEADSSSTFGIDSGPASFDEPAGAPCPGAHLPFAPSLTGGATNIQAGAFSPLTLTFSRKDGEQNIQSAEAHLPPGLSGILSNIELCPEPQANLGECGPNSLIGETTVSVGVGGDPFTVGGGKFYLTGPYNGRGSCTMGSPGCAPFGITFEVPAKAGPFDLKRNTANPAGEDPCDCVVVRGKIEVNPINAAITIKSDLPGSPYAIPTSIEGIPLEIQHINATTTRGNFQFNPTNCEKMAATGAVQSSENTTFNVSVPFQVTNCAILGFKPRFKVSTSGKTSRKNGASLNVHLTYPKAPFGSQANIKSVKVDLPKQLPSRLTTLQKACTAAQFEANPAGCPVDSMVGHATAITPLIPVPLTGPAYFVSYGGAKFPELVIVLQGYGVTLDLHGETFINKAGITSSTFHTVPDAPVGSFELNLPEGKYSALAANGNLCQMKLAMPTLFDAQNGMVIKQSTPINVTGCPKHKAAKKAKKTARKAKRKGSTR